MHLRFTNCSIWYFLFIHKWKIKTKKLPTFYLCTWFWNVVHVGVNLLELETTQQQNNPCLIMLIKKWIQFVEQLLKIVEWDIYPSFLANEWSFKVKFGTIL